VVNHKSTVSLTFFLNTKSLYGFKLKYKLKPSTAIMEQNNKIVLFQENTIRRIWHNEAWWFVVVDVIAVLTESTNPGVYWRVMKKRLLAEGNETVTNCNALKMEGIWHIFFPLPLPKHHKPERWNHKVFLIRSHRIILSFPLFLQHQYLTAGFAESVPA
jgi:hypothetical protein